MKELNRVHLNGLRALEAVGRLGTLARAAGELGVSAGAVSQQIIKAEAQLGRPVFVRQGKGLTRTEFGERFLARLTSGFRALDEAVASAQRHADTVLTISVAPVFASKWLVPRLDRYARANPGMRLRLDATVDIVDPDVSDIDVAIRVGPGNWPGVRLEKLLDQEVFPVCAPNLAARIDKPADLLGLPVVSDYNSTVKWDCWLAPFGLSAKDMQGGSSFNDAALALDAAIAGQGVMLAWQTLAHYALKTGALVLPFPERARTGNAYWLVTSDTRREEPKVARFKNWLRSELAETERDFALLAQSAAVHGDPH